jgi:hypothetical protein
MAVVRGRTFVVGTLSDERKVFFCNLTGEGVFEHDIFPPGNYLEFPRRVQGIIEENESLRVFTDAGIHRIIFNGDSRNDWQIMMGEVGSGTRSPRSIGSLMGRSIFLGQDALRTITAELSDSRIGVGIQDIVDGTSDLTAVYGLSRPIRDEYWLGINTRLVALKGESWREITKSNLNMIQLENGEVGLVTATDLLSAVGGSEAFGIELKTNPLDFDIPAYLKRLDYISLVYQCDAIVTVELFLDRSATAGVILTFAANTGYATEYQYLPHGTFAREVEVRITAPSTLTIFRLEELSLSGEPIRKLGEI